MQRKVKERTEIATGCKFTSRLARTLFGARHQELEDTKGDD